MITKSAKAFFLGILMFSTSSFATDSVNKGEVEDTTRSLSALSMDEASKQGVEATAKSTLCYLGILSPDQVEVSAERTPDGLKVIGKGENLSLKLYHFSYTIPQNSVSYFIDFIIKEMGDETPHQKILNMFKALR